MSEYKVDAPPPLFQPAANLLAAKLSPSGDVNLRGSRPPVDSGVYHKGLVAFTDFHDLLLRVWLSDVLILRYSYAKSTSIIVFSIQVSYVLHKGSLSLRCNKELTRVHVCANSTSFTCCQINLSIRESLLFATDNDSHLYSKLVLTNLF